MIKRAYNLITDELKGEWEMVKKLIKKLKRPYRRKKLIERKTMPFDAGFEADMQAVAEKNVYPAGFSVSVEVPPTTPVVVTEKFVAGQPPVVV